MKVIILHVFIGILSVVFCQEETWEKSPASIRWKSIAHQMTFREPIVFTPFELKAGYLNYGGKNYWSGAPFNTSTLTETDLPVLLDSTQYQFNIIDALTNRAGMFIEVDFLRTNLPHFIVHQNYLDLQIGLGAQYTVFSSNPSLPSESGKEWDTASSRGDYYFHPRSIGLNINTSLGWQISRTRANYLYHSLGINWLSLYESEGGDRSLTGTGLSESFGIGTKYIFRQTQGNFSYTLGIEAKWTRLYMISVVDVPDSLSPIYGIDLRASGIFLTTGIQFGGKRTDGDIAYSYMINNDFISAAESFESFLAKERRHGRREKAVNMLQYCQSQVPYQQMNLGVEDLFKSNFDKAVDWFDAAEAAAEEDLKIEIQSHRKRIAGALLDSVQNHKNEMTIAEAEQLTRTARELSPELILGDQVLAGIYLDRGKLNTKIGDYSGAIENYLKAIQLYPAIESIVTEKLNELTILFMKDAYFAAKDDELFLVIKSLKSIIELNPDLANEFDPYIFKLETRLESQYSDGENKFAQEYIENRKHETIPDYSHVLQLGMTYDEVKKIRGKPKYIDKMNEPRRQFEMWTYPTDSTISRLYFENNMLVRIEE